MLFYINYWHGHQTSSILLITIPRSISFVFDPREEPSLSTADTSPQLKKGEFCHCYLSESCCWAMWKLTVMTLLMH